MTAKSFSQVLDTPLGPNAGVTPETYMRFSDLLGILSARVCASRHTPGTKLAYVVPAQLLPAGVAHLVLSFHVHALERRTRTIGAPADGSARRAYPQGVAPDMLDGSLTGDCPTQFGIVQIGVTATLHEGGDEVWTRCPAALCIAFKGTDDYSDMIHNACIFGEHDSESDEESEGDEEHGDGSNGGNDGDDEAVAVPDTVTSSPAGDGPDKLPYLAFHAGFKRRFQQGKERIERAMQAALDGPFGMMAQADIPLLIAGHSMGGAVAQMVGFRHLVKFVNARTAEVRALASPQADALLQAGTPALGSVVSVSSGSSAASLPGSATPNSVVVEACPPDQCARPHDILLASPAADEGVELSPLAGEAARQRQASSCSWWDQPFLAVRVVTLGSPPVVYTGSEPARSALARVQVQMDALTCERVRGNGGRPSGPGVAYLGIRHFTMPRDIVPRCLGSGVRTLANVVTLLGAAAPASRLAYAAASVTVMAVDVLTRNRKTKHRTQQSAGKQEGIMAMARAITSPLYVAHATQYSRIGEYARVDVQGSVHEVWGAHDAGQAAAVASATEAAAAAPAAAAEPASGAPPPVPARSDSASGSSRSPASAMPRGSPAVSTVEIQQPALHTFTPPRLTPIARDDSSAWGLDPRHIMQLKQQHVFDAYSAALLGTYAPQVVHRGSPLPTEPSQPSWPSAAEPEAAAPPEEALD